MPSRALAPLVALNALALACAPAPRPASPSLSPSPSPSLSPSPSPSPSLSPPPSPPLSHADALTRARALAADLDHLSGAPAAQKTAFFTRAAADDRELARTLAGAFDACLASTDAHPAACEPKSDDEVAATSALFEVLGHGGDASAPGGPALRVAVRLAARGVTGATFAVEHLLERRARAASGACAPPSTAEIAAAKASLADLAIVTTRADRLEARWPTAAEEDELAYLYAALAESGPEVGSAREDTAAKPLAADHPDVARRATLRAEIAGALASGDLERHLASGEAYLASLGYPGPMRLGEEGDERWGGAGASYVVRDLARSAEILGRHAQAEGLWRRAAPGGGMCGTSTPYHVDLQVEGVVRAGEQARGCRAAIAERLFGVAIDSDHAYGPERLAEAGFDVPRLYAAAWLTLGRDDRPALERALAALPDRSKEALARLASRGTEAWATRLRAIPGYADAARGQAIPRLLALAEAGPTSARVEAIAALGELAWDHGWDPCVPTTTGHLYGHGSSRSERKVRGLMDRCETRLDAKATRDLGDAIAKLAGDPSHEVREAAARTLGHLGSPRARPTLERLARDRFADGTQTCSTRPDGQLGPCTDRHPVADAAREALDAIAKADATRAEPRRTPRRPAR
jgi:hypothetical protein